MSIYRSCLDSVLVSRASLDSQDSLSQSLASPQEDQHMEDDFRQPFFSTFFPVVFSSKFVSLRKEVIIGTGGAVCKGATPSVEQPGGRGFKPRLRSLLD
jgi:hypothetical protein